MKKRGKKNVAILRYNIFKAREGEGGREREGAGVANLNVRNPRVIYYLTSYLHIFWKLGRFKIKISVCERSTFAHAFEDIFFKNHLLIFTALVSVSLISSRATFHERKIGNPENRGVWVWNTTDARDNA